MTLSPLLELLLWVHKSGSVDGPDGRVTKTAWDAAEDGDLIRINLVDTTRGNHILSPKGEAVVKAYLETGRTHF